MAHHVADCNFEKQTKWGAEVSLLVILILDNIKRREEFCWIIYCGLVEYFIFSALCEKCFWKQLWKLVFKNLFDGCKTKTLLRILNVFNLLSIFFKYILKTTFIYIILFLIIFHICMIIFFKTVGKNKWKQLKQLRDLVLWTQFFLEDSRIIFGKERFHMLYIYIYIYGKTQEA